MKYLDIILDDFYICKGRLKTYADVTPTILAEREGLKVIIEYGEERRKRKMDMDKAGNQDGSNPNEIRRSM